MKSKTYVASIWFVFSFFQHSASLAKDPVGIIESKVGVDHWIMRGNQEVPARGGAPLFVGDEIVVKGIGSKVVLRLAGEDSAKILNTGDRLIVDQPAEMKLKDRARRFLSNISWAFESTDQDISVNTAARSIISNEKKNAGNKLVKLPLFDTPFLFATHDAKRLVIHCCGASSNISLTSDEHEPITAQVSDFGYGTVTIINVEHEFPSVGTTGLSRIAISSLDNERALDLPLRWIAVDDVPSPKWHIENNVTAQDKFEWAHWLLNDYRSIHGDAYNLIATNMLYEAREDFWLAAIYLEQVTACKKRN